MQDLMKDNIILPVLIYLLHQSLERNILSSEYHTSLDNFDLVSLEGIKGSVRVAKSAILILDKKTFQEQSSMNHMVKEKYFQHYQRNAKQN